MASLSLDLFTAALWLNKKMEQNIQVKEDRRWERQKKRKGTETMETNIEDEKRQQT